MTLNLRKSAKGLIFSNRGSLYTRYRFQSFEKRTAVKYLSFNSRGMKEDDEAYIRYYNQIRLHTSNGDCFQLSLSSSQ